MDLIGERVRLRASSEEDAPVFAKVLADPAMVGFLGPWAWVPYGPREALDFVRNPRPDSLGWTIECLADGAVIGSSGLHGIDHRNRNCVWGIWVGPPERWNQGFGTEACRLSVAYAFDHLAMEKVSLTVLEGNQRGRAAYLKAGFSSEGVQRRHIWLRGRLADVELMAVFRDHPLYARGGFPPANPPASGERAAEPG